MDEFVRRFERLPVSLMVLRILDHSVRNNRILKTAYEQCKGIPYATELLNLLGRVYLKQENGSEKIHDGIDEKAMQLAEQLKPKENAEEGDDFEEAIENLQNTNFYNNDVLRLAEVLMTLWGKTPRNNTMGALDSSLMVNRPNGLARNRSVKRQTEGNTSRIVVLTDSVLDYLVHTLVLPNGNKEGYVPLSFDDFLGRLRENYGFHVDTAPPNRAVSHDLLRENRSILERRLRDLGLLIGVNDSESMKTLKPRF